jgi:hypothetical protein
MVLKIHCEKGPKLNKLSIHEKPILIDVIWIVNHSIQFTPMAINLFMWEIKPYFMFLETCY